MLWLYKLSAGKKKKNIIEFKDDDEIKKNAKKVKSSKNNILWPQPHT